MDIIDVEDLVGHTFILTKKKQGTATIVEAINKHDMRKMLIILAKIHHVISSKYNITRINLKRYYHIMKSLIILNALRMHQLCGN